MIELPEALNIASELRQTICDKKKTIRRVLSPTKKHKFCWFSAQPDDYSAMLEGASVFDACGFGSFVEMVFSNGLRLSFNDGVNVRFGDIADTAKDFQLSIQFSDNTALTFSVAMYGGIYLHDGSFANEYYLKSKAALSPFSDDFPAYFRKISAESSALSAKAFLATQQRFPGVGNGVLQDILFTARMNPRRKLSTFSSEETERLLVCTANVLSAMTSAGGRDTERNIFGAPGGYRTLMSARTYRDGCPLCGGPISKETYMGGSLYYCPVCQPLKR